MIERILIIFSSYIGEKHFNNQLNTEMRLDSLNREETNRIETNSKIIDSKLMDVKELIRKIENHRFLLDSLARISKKNKEKLQTSNYWSTN